MTDDNEQRMAYERIINNKFADMVDQYGERPLLEEGDIEFVGTLDDILGTRDHPSAPSFVVNDFVKEVFSELGLLPEGPEDYYECYHDPSRWRCRGRRGPRTQEGTEYPLD